MHQKAEHLHIRASELEKATLARAAQAKNMSVSQFVLQTAMPIAEEIVSKDAGSVQTLFHLNAKDWAEFNRLLDAPTREIPELRGLLLAKAPWEK
jgi:uncharacterized protein (DUF1778 family)